jgi:peptidoglycan/xylan/chitin deacetylase (PgdA/CDA1 family)
LILTLHGIGDPPAHVEDSELSVWVGRDVCEATLDEVARRRGVLVTFDDGNRSDVEVALPALRRRGLDARFFIVADRLDQPGYLTRDEVRELSDAGMTVGFHGLHHRSWRSFGDEELRDDLERGRSMLEDTLERAVTEASCPFGEYDRRVLGHLRRLGFQRVYTSDGGTTRPGAWLQARNSIGRDWAPTPALLDGHEPIPPRLVRSAKRLVKRLR